MKCLILAGGRGDRMWPLSRKNNPKQFISIKNNHSIFQDTVARNMAFCDEFIISTSAEYESVIENQMKAFRGLTYRCIYEELGHNTAAPIILAALSLAPSEVLFVVSSDHLIMGDSYRNDIIEAKRLAKNGNIVTFGMDIVRPDTRFGYIKYNADDVIKFTNKPDEATAIGYMNNGDYYINSGMFMFTVGDFFNSLRKVAPDEYDIFNAVYQNRVINGGNTLYTSALMERTPNKSIEELYFEKNSSAKVIHSVFDWQDVGSLDDLDNFKIQSIKEEQIISNKCENTTVINQCENKLVLVNHLKDVMVVNTDNAIYIGNKGDSNDLKEIIRASESMWGYFDRSSVFYRSWGEYHVFMDDKEKRTQVKKVIVLPGHTIPTHKHSTKNESLSIISGTGLITVDGITREMKCGDAIIVNSGCYHQISCTSEEDFVYIETATNLDYEINEEIVAHHTLPSEAALGYEQEPFVLLSPVYKDYLWGGCKLRDKFGKKCDYDIIAESWELSAHPDGQCIVASGKYKGLTFGEYLHRIGDEGLGWKYVSGRSFPLLIKLIDAKNDLSIQVHPDDDYALEHENEYGKSELWHILEAEPGASIYMGFKQDVSREQLLNSINDGSIINLLNKIEVKKDETYFIPAGTVHAIGKGCLICEVQQNSNSTYRLYDFDRVDKYGNKRKLDIDKALDVADLTAYKGNRDCKYFECEFVSIEDEYTLMISDESFCSFVVTEGNGIIKSSNASLNVKKGDCIFVPGKKGVIHLEGNIEIVLARL